MIKKYIFILSLLINTCINAQNPSSFEGFLSHSNNENPILTSDLLEFLNWDSIVSFCKANEDYVTNKSNFHLLTNYSYNHKRSDEDIHLRSYNGKVLEFSCSISKHTYH